MVTIARLAAILYVHLLVSTMGLDCFGGVDAPLPSWPMKRFYLEPHSAMESCRNYPSPATLLQSLDGTDRSNLSLALQALSSPAYEAAAKAAFVLFVAKPRSGHSLIGSLLDAHQNAMIANEADLFGVYLRGGMNESRSTLFNRLINNALSCGIAGRFQSGYDYTVPGAFTGQWKCRIDVIGDKKGGVLASELLRPDGLRNFGDFVDTLQIRMVKVIVVLTNDEDGKARRAAKLLINNMTWPRKNVEIQTIEVDRFACNPRAQLLRLCSFLGLFQYKEFLAAAVARVNTTFCNRTGGRSAKERAAGVSLFHGGASM